MIPAPKIRHNAVERACERTLFASRWLLVPFYLGLAVALLLLVVQFLRQMGALLLHVFEIDRNQMTVEVLSLIDLSLIGNLILIVIFAGYENFVSRFELPGDKDRPDWMGHVDFADLKLKVLASIIAISAVHLLEVFMNVEHLSDREIAWQLGILLTFVISGLMLAAIDFLSERKRP